MVFRSSTKAEYESLATAVAKLSWYKLCCDNLNSFALARNSILHAHTKHVQIDLHFERDQVQARLLKLVHVPSQDLTKPLSQAQLSLLIRSKSVQF